ncbi:MAG: hypothetical protein V3W11_03750 [bacterium]
MGNCKIAGVLAAGVLLWAPAFAAAEYQLEEVGVFGPYTSADHVCCSADGTAWAYWVNEDGERYTVINGEKRGPYGIPQPPSLRSSNTVYFSAGGESWAFWALTSEGFYLTVNNNTYGPYENTSDIYFSQDGSAWGFTGYKNGGLYLTINGTEDGPYKTTTSSYLSYFVDDRKWAKWLENDDGWYVFINDVAYGPYTQSHTLRTSSDYKHWIMTGKTPEGYHLIVDGEEIGFYEKCSIPAISENGEYWGVIVTEEGKVYTLINGAKAGPFLGAGGIGFSPKKNAPYFIKKGDDGYYFTLDGEEVTGPYSCYNYTTPVFSANGESWACKAYDLEEKTVYIIVNGEVFGPYDDFPSDPFLSPDGSKSAFLVPTESGQYMVINGEEKGPYANLAGVELWEYTATISEDGSAWAIRYHRPRVINSTTTSVGPDYLAFFSQSRLWGPYDTDNSCFRVSESFNSVWWYSEIEPEGWIGFVEGSKLGPYVSIAGYPPHPELFKGVYALEDFGDGYYKLFKYVE